MKKIISAFVFLGIMRFMRLVFIWGVLLLLLADAYAQEESRLPNYQTVFSQNFGLADNFPDRCVLNTFIDPAGKLWVQPCRPTQHNYFIHLFQFDGYQATIEDWGLTKSYYSRIKDILPNGMIFGFWHVWNNNTDWTAFLFDSQKQQLTKFSADSLYHEPASMTSMLADKDNKIIAFTEHQSRVTVSSFSEQGLKPLLNISRDQLGLKPFPSSVYLMGVEEKGYWLVEERGLPMLINDKGDILKSYTPDPEQSPFLPKIEDEMFPDPKVFQLQKGKGPIFYLPWTHERFFVENRSTGRLEALDILPDGWQMWPINFNPRNVVYQDKPGNLLFLALNENGERSGLLLDTTFQLFNYGPVLSEVGEVQGLMSDDFQKYVFISSTLGLTTAVVKPEERIQTLPTGASRGIMQLSEEEFLIIRSQGGIELLRANTLSGSTEPFFEPGYGKDFYYHNGEMKILKNDDHHVWITVSKNLYRCKTDGSSCDSIPLGDYIAKQIFLDDQTIALISDFNYQLYFLDLPSRTIKPYLEKGKQPSFPNKVHDMLVDKEGILWLASSWGLWRIDHKNQNSSLLTTKDGFSDYRFLCIQEDKKGRLWLGTFAGGVQIYEPKTGKIKVVDVSNGLSQNTVVTLLEDQDGDIWAATQNGLTLLSAEGERITELYAEDGLTDNEFNRYSSYRADDGRLLLGTVNGTNVINPDQIKASLKYDIKPRLYLTSVAYYSAEASTEVQLEKNLEQLSQIVIPAGQRYLKLKFALSNYLQPQKNKFAYKMEGFDEDWNWIGEKNSLELQSLPPGNYNILIRGEDHRGISSQEILKVPLLVKNYFYRQWWFYFGLLMVIVVVGAIWILSLRKVNLGLESEVERRTHQIKRDKELIEQQAKELRQLDELKSRFFTNISHELRTPITLINAPIEQYLKEQGEKIGEKGRATLNMVLKSGRNLLALVEELLDLSRLEANKLQLQESPTKLVEFCLQLKGAFESRAAMKHIQYEFTTQLSKDDLYWLDKSRMTKIINNLLSNAFKFTSDGGSIELSLEKGKESLLIKVRDTGRGIPLEDLPFVFERYYQTKRKDLPTEGGLGVGLALSRELARLMGGDLTVQSEWEKGSLFTLQIPAREVEEMHNKETLALDEEIVTENFSEQLLPVAAKEISGNPKKPQILIVEDNPDMQRLLNDLLAATHNCLFANDGAEAWNWIQNGDLKNDSIELIISDIMMPKMDGYELLECIKKDPHWQKKPMIMLTARAEEEDKLQALRLGVDDYLLKPFSPAELTTRIANLLSNYRMRQTYREAAKIKLDIAFENKESSDQIWLKELERLAKEALEIKIDMTAAYLAGQLSVSERQLLRRIKALTGLSTKQYIQEVKLQKARNLLENKTFNTVSEIAYASGFNTPAYFTKIFEKHYGRKPKDYLIRIEEL